MSILTVFARKLRPRLPQSLGARGEQWAAEEYLRRGYRVVARNTFNRKGKQRGELDLVAVGGSAIIFVEVKTRVDAAGKFGAPVESVTRSKQRRVIQAAQLFLAAHPEYAVLRPQIDVCIVLVSPVDKTLRSVTIMENSVDDLN